MPRSSPVIAFVLFLLALCPQIAIGQTMTDTSLHAAAARDDAAAIQQLLAGGAPIDARDVRRRTALLVATHDNRLHAARALIEAASIDGAGPWRRFWNIQLPLLSPTSFFLLVINIVYAFFDTFGIIDAATQGGPGQSTSILVYKVYLDGFKALDLGGSAAQSVILMCIVVVLTVIQFRYVEKKVQY